MKSLIIKETAATPKIEFDLDSPVFVLEGCSRPEDVRDFYAPIITWLTDFKGVIDDAFKTKFQAEPLIFKFKFDYHKLKKAQIIYKYSLFLHYFSNFFEK